MLSAQKPARLAALAAALLPLTVQAQAARDADRPSGWTELYAPRVDYEGITRAARAAAYTNLAELERIFWRIPEIASPKEFVVKKQYFGGARPNGMTNGVASYSLFLWFFGRVGPDRSQVAGEGCRCIGITINPGTGEQKTDEQGKGFLIEPEVGDPIPGAAAVYGRMTPDGEGGVSVLLTRGGTFPFTTMSREEYLQAQIFELEGKDQAKLKQAREALEKTPYEQWLAEAPQRKKDRDELALSLRGIKTPEEIRQVIAEQEATERRVTAQLRAQDEETRKQFQTTTANLTGPGDALRAQIAAMSAEERASPAMVARNWELLPVGAPNTARILTPILDFWRVRSSPVEIHSILVTIGGGTGDEKAYPETKNAVYQVLQKLDWAALKRMVEEP
jgi:hypothetical protein